MSKKRKYSSSLVDGIDQAGARSMLRPTGCSDEDFKKPQVERKLTFLDIVDKLCGIYLYFYSMGKLGKKLESKNVNWTYKKNLKLK